LRYASAQWAESPWMVVLAGNGHYDYLGTLNSEVNPLPPLLMHTNLGLFASDGLFTDLDGDGLPDLAIGRLPARTSSELDAMIGKIQAFETQFGEAWQKELVFAADIPDTSAGDFDAANEQLAALALPGGHDVARIYLSQVPLTQAREQLMGRFQNGAGFIHYTGHGGRANLSSENLLTEADVRAMNNTRRPIVVALSCLVGRYEAPGSDCLGELLLRSAGGAVAVWGPSGLSYNDPALVLGEAFYQTLLQDGSGTLGLAVLRARRAVQGNAFDGETFAIYNLLGDPALKLGGVPGGHAQDQGFAEWRWQRFSPEDLTNAVVSAPDADVDGSGANFVHYALGTGPGGSGRSAGLNVLGKEASGDLLIQWKRRVARRDVAYRLRVTEDLLGTWEDQPSDLVTTAVGTDPDGVMETVRTRINRPNANQLFIDLRVNRQ